MAIEMFEKMISELDKVKEMLNVGKNTGKLPDIERDIMLSKLRNIYEFLLMYHPDVLDSKVLKSSDTEKKKVKRK